MIGKDTVIPFGKYKGKTGAYVAQRDPRYILWIERNLDRISIDASLKKLAVCVGMMHSEDEARAYGSASDWGFSEF